MLLLVKSIDPDQTPAHVRLNAECGGCCSEVRVHINVCQICIVGEQFNPGKEAQTVLKRVFNPLFVQLA
jgi:hypothetical protein